VAERTQLIGVKVPEAVVVETSDLCGSSKTWWLTQRLNKSSSKPALIGNLNGYF
jgi:hypothetical protein